MQAAAQPRVPEQPHDLVEQPFLALQPVHRGVAELFVHRVDIEIDRLALADNLAQQGPFGFYDRGFFADYTPGYLYVLWLVGIVGRALGGIGDLIKLPAIIADGIMAYLVWSMVREIGGYLSSALHLMEAARGVFDSRSLILYLSVTTFFLFATVKAIEARR